MGLDMYAYRIKKCTETEIKNIVATGIVPTNICFCSQDSIDAEPELVGDLEGIMTPVSFVDYEQIDWRKFRTDNNVPEPTYLVSKECDMEGRVLKFVFRDIDNKEYTVIVTVEEFKKTYPQNAVVNGMCWRQEEVGYWRKAYDLQEDIHEAYEGCIYNCGYHNCNEEMIYCMLDYDKEDSPYDGHYGRLSENITVDDDDIFLFEWY